MTNRLPQDQSAISSFRAIAFQTTMLVVCMLCIAVPQLVVAAKLDDVRPYLENGFSLDLGVFFPAEIVILRRNEIAGDLRD